MKRKTTRCPRRTKCLECPDNIKARDMACLKFLEERAMRMREGIAICAMLDSLCRALEIANTRFAYNRKERDVFMEALGRERREWATFMRELQIVQAAGADTLCGSRWINAKALNETIDRYTKGDSEIYVNGGCAR